MAGDRLGPEASWAFLVAGIGIKNGPEDPPCKVDLTVEESDRQGFRVVVEKGPVFHYVRLHTREPGATNKTIVEERFYFPGDLIKDNQGKPISPETPAAEQHQAVISAVGPYVRLFKGFSSSKNSIYFGTSPDGQPEISIEQIAGGVAERGGQRWEKPTKPSWEITPHRAQG